MQIQQVIRAAIPDATTEDCEWILWERTPYPCGGITARSIYKAASQFIRAVRNHLQLCVECHNKVSEGRCLCDKCQKGLEIASQEFNNQLIKQEKG